jgi:ATP-dependent helicase HrpA
VLKQQKYALMNLRDSINSDNRRLLRPQIRYTAGLPILEKKDAIIGTLRAHQVLIVAGETGSGKTTQLPLICLEAGYGTKGKIGCTQPRRIAATSIAHRVASECRSIIGREIGYKIRFSDHDSPQTSIKFMTDGILLTEIERSPLLKQYEVLIIDEAHERSLNIDFIIGYLRELLPKRPDLKCIISSATIDTTLFSKAFGDAPVIEVSGRMYPVEVYHLSEEEERDDTIYVDRAVKAAEDILDLYNDGDLLVFMPTERDIRETCNRLGGLKRDNMLILPLFSRLSKKEQQAIFAQTHLRKIVVATNIAETSITVPGIKFVIDTGLARMARYAPRLRTNRLPVEPVSRAAADQRMGRCGRVSDGVCIRLYTQKDFASREAFTLPEIKRSNLAGVILSMIAHRLGTIESFAFLEPPSRAAITEGYAQLRELGAINKTNHLTKLGRLMARLPLDPHIARMVIAARDEKALREVKVIAAALSIVDPRERPFEKRAEADTMHARFRVPGSDFMSFVKLWDSYKEEWMTLQTQNRMRKFCREHFLSFPRMQEWHDVHRQISETVSSLRGFHDNREPAPFDAVHRALLSGLLVNFAQKNTKGKYQAPRGRELIIFPGSALQGQKPDWLFCHEVLETSQVFARTAAPIEPAWLEQLAPHLCTRNYLEPWFDEKSGVVRATEKVSLFGMNIATHPNVAYTTINRERAGEVFIREALVDEHLQSEHHFYTHNKKLRQEIDNLETKLRTRSLFAGEAAIESFYKKHLHGIGGIHDLNRLIKERGNDSFLKMKRNDLLTTTIPGEVEQFPDAVTIGGKSFQLIYTFEPGGDQDGITLPMHQHDASLIPDGSLPYLLPVLWPEYIAALLRSLPKSQRKRFIPIPETANKIADNIRISEKSFMEEVAGVIRTGFGIVTDPAQFDDTEVPSHLKIRRIILNKPSEESPREKGSTISNSGDRQPDTAWKSAFGPYEKTGLTEWSFDTLPSFIEVPSTEGMPLFGYPALVPQSDSVSLRVFSSQKEASAIHEKGVSKLLEILLSDEFAWIQRDLRFHKELKLLCNPFGGAEACGRILFCMIKNHLLSFAAPAPREETAFTTLNQAIRDKIKGIGFQTLSLLEETIRSFNECCVKINKHKNGSPVLRKELRGDLDRYMNEFREALPLERFRQYPRYLRAFAFRIDRAFLDPVKYSRNRELLRQYQDCVKRDTTSLPRQKAAAVEEFICMVEELAISLFAQQEIKTRFPVSPKRLGKKLEAVEKMEINPEQAK